VVGKTVGDTITVRGATHPLRGHRASAGAPRFTRPPASSRISCHPTDGESFGRTILIALDTPLIVGTDAPADVRALTR